MSCVIFCGLYKISMSLGITYPGTKVRRYRSGVT
jgi:hypothetical protein